MIARPASGRIEGAMNRLLIAAAPDLLSACIRLVECDASDLSEAYAQAYAAIEKAGGWIDDD